MPYKRMQSEWDPKGFSLLQVTVTLLATPTSWPLILWKPSSKPILAT
jgi:hypothetical protein